MTSPFCSAGSLIAQMTHNSSTENSGFVLLFVVVCAALFGIFFLVLVVRAWRDRRAADRRNEAAAGLAARREEAAAPLTALGIEGDDAPAAFHDAFGRPVAEAARREWGAVIAGVRPGSPADEGGVQAGDRVTAADGTNVTSVDDLSVIIRHHVPRRPVSLTVVRGDQEQQLRIVLPTSRGNVGV
jgi:S1-C subfamily serine protease